MAGSPKKKDRLARWRDWTSKPQQAMSELCEFIETGGSAGHLLRFSQNRDFAYTTLRDWIDADDARTAMYARARDRRADVMADEVVAIADEDPGVGPQGGTDSGAVNHLRLRVDARKWAASKLAPRRYGDKLELAGGVEHSHDAVGELRDFLMQTGSRLPIKGD